MFGYSAGASFLIFGAVSSFIASFLHIVIIIGGPAWYRFFGAGEPFARAVENGKILPVIITFGIALVLAVWGLYALKGAGLLTSFPLPLVRPALLAISTIYILRGLVLIPSLIPNLQPSGAFAIWSSAICLSMGLAYAIGLMLNWSALK